MSYISFSTYDACLLHSKADRAVRTVVANSLEKYNLTMMEWLLLATVCYGPKEGMTMSAIADKLDVTLPQITALMNQIMETKLLKQKISAEDKRSRRLICTKAGKNLVEDIETSVRVSLKEWLKDLPEDTWNEYLKTLQTISITDIPKDINTK
jgi:DNA-binding MarR family transcriptional regulator